MNKIGRIGTVVIYGILILISAITLYPLLNILAVSMSDRTAYIRNPMMIIPKNITFASYAAVWQHPLVLSSYLNTIIITLVGVALSMSLTATLAYPLSERGLRGKKFFMSMLIFTMFFSGGLIPNFYLVRSLGLLDSLWALIIPGSLSVYNMILMKNAFEGLPDSLKESARIDGANDLLIFGRIVLPLSMPIVATLTLFYVVGRWNSFFNAIIYINSRSRWTLQLLLREIVMTTETLLDDGVNVAAIPAESVKFAVIVISILPIMCVYPFLQRFFIKGVMVGAVKG